MKRVELIKKVIDDFNHENIHYCVLRNYEFLLDPKEKAGFDFDVSIAESDKEKAEAIFAKHNFIKKPPQFSRKHQGYAYFSVEELKKIGFDVQWNGVVWNDMYYLTEDIYKNSVKAGNFHILCDEDAFIMYLCHSVLGKRYFKEKYKKKLQELAKRDIDFVSIASRVNKLFKIKNSANIIIQKIKDGKFEEIIKMRYRLIISFMRWSHIYQRTNLFFRWFREKVIRKKQPLIAFIGPDGAGKSTTAARIEQIIKDNNLPVTYVYLGRGKGHFLPITKTGRVIHERMKTKKSKYLLKIIYTCAAPVYTLDLLLRYFFTIRPKRKKVITITDRYGTDIYLMPRISDRWRKVLFSLFPKPTLTFYLYNDSNVLYRRKRQQSAQELAHQMELFDKLAPHLNAIKIKTENEIKVIEEVAKRVFECLARIGNN